MDKRDTSTFTNLMSGKISRQTIICVIILVSFIPLLSPGGVSINFSFLLLLFFCPIYRLDVVPAYVLGIVAAVIFSYGLNLFLYVSETPYLGRQFFSFGAFLSFLFILFLRIPIKIETIYLMLIIVSTVYSIIVLYHIFSKANLNLGDFRYIKSGLREYVTHWPQRFPCVMMAAFFFSLLKSKTNKLFLIPLTLISICLFFTFTRAIYVSLIFGFIYLFFFSMIKFKLRIKKRSIFIFTFVTGVTLYILFFISKFQLEAFEILVAVVTEAFSSILSFFDGNVQANRSGGSDSQRMYHWKKALEIWSNRPLFGTGFAGIYQFSSMGSIHNQYLDILFQTGIVGLSLYLCLWFIAFKFSFYRPEIFSGLLAIFFYGAFHESTKLSYVGFLLMLICSKAFSDKLKKDRV